MSGSKNRERQGPGGHLPNTWAEGEPSHHLWQGNQRKLLRPRRWSAWELGTFEQAALEVRQHDDSALSQERFTTSIQPIPLDAKRRSGPKSPALLQGGTAMRTVADVCQCGGTRVTLIFCPTSEKCKAEVKNGEACVADLVFATSVVREAHHCQRLDANCCATTNVLDKRATVFDLLKKPLSRSLFGFFSQSDRFRFDRSSFPKPPAVAAHTRIRHMKSQQAAERQTSYGKLSQLFCVCDVFHSKTREAHEKMEVFENK